MGRKGGRECIDILKVLVCVCVHTHVDPPNQIFKNCSYSHYTSTNKLVSIESYSTRVLIESHTTCTQNMISSTTYTNTQPTHPLTAVSSVTQCIIYITQKQHTTYMYTCIIKLFIQYT